MKTVFANRISDHGYCMSSHKKTAFCVSSHQLMDIWAVSVLWPIPSHPSVKPPLETPFTISLHATVSFRRTHAIDFISLEDCCLCKRIFLVTAVRQIHTLQFTDVKGSVVFSIFARCASITAINFRTFHHPRKETLHPFAMTFDHTHHKETTNLHSISTDLPVLGSNYRRNHTVGGLLWLLSLA